MLFSLVIYSNSEIGLLSAYIDGRATLVRTIITQHHTALPNATINRIICNSLTDHIQIQVPLSIIEREINTRYINILIDMQAPQKPQKWRASIRIASPCSMSFKRPAA